MLPTEAFFLSQLFLFLKFRFEGKTQNLSLTKMNMFTPREQVMESIFNDFCREKNMQFFSNNILSCIAVAVLISSNAWADHEPHAYSYNGARSRANIIEFAPSAQPRLLNYKSVSSDPVVNRKMDDLLEGIFSQGIAGIVVKGEEVLYQKYKKGEDTNLYPAWSMTKSLVSLTVGHALCNGHIKSLDDLAQQYVSELEGTVWGRASLRQLLQMRSGTSKRGLDSGGDYLYSNTSSGLDMVKGVFSVKDAYKRFSEVPDSVTPGSRYAYSNFDTDALGLVVAAASGQPFARYFESTVLKGARLEHPSVFHLDRTGHPVTHAYFFATLRDFARLGQYVIELHDGQNGNSCLKDYMGQALTPYTEATNSYNKSPIGYGFQFWLDTGFGQSKKEAVRMSGHQGQDIFMNLRTGKVAVVLGTKAILREKSHSSTGIIEWLVR
jgi:CubicO group peptidase (beta-lactamase class C family)